MIVGAREPLTEEEMAAAQQYAECTGKPVAILDMTGKTAAQPAREREAELEAEAG